MPIKRLTLEFDDSPDRRQPTTVPEGLRLKEAGELKQRDLTSIPSEQDVEETISPKPGAALPRATGRTVADLIADSMDDARAMATILMFVPFIVFGLKVQKFGDLSDLIYPGAYGVLLNAVWFGVSLIRHFRK
ncbi:hypothetical protein HY439_02420 [Candidatus Microgenomates bacterium]|nr:hypothetical protein [Candidatus Microgenomates bacterium]